MASSPTARLKKLSNFFLVFELILLTQVRRLEEVVDQLEDWFALRNSVELDDLCLEVGISGEKLFLVKVWRSFF